MSLEDESQFESCNDGAHTKLFRFSLFPQSLVGKTFYEVHRLSLINMSPRKIAATLGVSHKVVRSALRAHSPPPVAAVRESGVFTSIPSVVTLATLAFVIDNNENGTVLDHQAVFKAVSVLLHPISVNSVEPHPVLCSSTTN